MLPVDPTAVTVRGPALSGQFRLHDDGSAGALGHADPAPLAVVVLEAVPVAEAEFHNGVVRTDPEAVVTFEAVPARHAPACFEQCICLVEALHDLVECRGATRDLEARTFGSRRVGVVPGVQQLETSQLMANRRLEGLAA
jgi:hypothetical protein